VEVLWPQRRSIKNTQAHSEEYNLIQNEFPHTTARFRQTMCEKALGIYASLNTRLETLHRCVERRPALQRTITKLNETRPEINRFSLDLGAKHVSFHDKIIHIASTGLIPFDIPFVATKPFNKWNRRGDLMNYIQVYENNMVKVVFKIDSPVSFGKTKLGCDVGINKLFSLSNGHSGPEFHIPLRRIARRKVGLNGRRKALTQRNNEMCYAINQIRWASVRELHIEDLKYMPKKKNYLRHWNYPFLLQKLTRSAEEAGVKVVRVPPQHTSRRCQNCGWTSIRNRFGERFRCEKCHHEADADINAAKNIRDITSRIQGNSRTGFFWPLAY
jgi:transposase